MQTLKELRDRAKVLGIVGRWGMNAEQLTQSVNTAELLKNCNEQEKEKVWAKEANLSKGINTITKNVVDDTGENWDEIPKVETSCKSYDKVIRTIFANGEKKEVLTVKPEVKQKFIQDAKIGTLVAFEIDGKVRSGKITNRSTVRKMLKIVCKNGREHTIPYESVLWVRKGGKWPQPIFELLIGGVYHGKNDDIKHA